MNGKKAVLISIRPEWCEKIAALLKALELRKSKPNIPMPFKCYIYQTRVRWAFNLLRRLGLDDLADALSIGSGKVIGEFVCDHILGHCEMANADLAEQQGCVRREDIYQYSDGKEVFGWHISNLVIYEKPMELKEFISDKALCYEDWLYGVHSGGRGSKGNYNSYLNALRLKSPPQSWCYVKELHCPPSSI